MLIGCKKEKKKITWLLVNNKMFLLNQNCFISIWKENVLLVISTYKIYYVCIDTTYDIK